MHAGKLDQRAAFASPTSTTDVYGGTEDGWQDEFIAWCSVRYLRGTETVMAARMDSKRPVLLTLRKSPDSEQVHSGWKATINGDAYNIREEPRPTDDRLYLEFIAEGGVAV